MTITLSCRILFLNQSVTVEVKGETMNKKLTLRLDDHLIESAKEYSAKTGKSVSKIVSDFFVIIKNEKLKKSSSITPTVQSLQGILKDAQFSEDDYKDHLKEKYL